MDESSSSGEDSPKNAQDDPREPSNDGMFNLGTYFIQRRLAALGQLRFEDAQYMAQLSQQTKVSNPKPATPRIPSAISNRLANDRQPVEKKLRFAEQEITPERALPLHPSVFRPLNPGPYTNQVNEFATLPKRLLRLGLTCTYPASSFNRPMGNPEWSLKSILQSRYNNDTDPRTVEYEAEFVWADGREASREWLTFDDLNWPWGIRIMRIFHQRNMFKPMDKRMQDQSVLNTEGTIKRSEWFNGKDIYKEEYLSKAIYLQTKYEQIELYEQTAAASKKLSRGRSTERPLSPHGNQSFLRLRGRSPARSPRKEDASDTDMTDVTSVSDQDASYYSEGEDPEMLATYQRAQEDFRAAGGSVDPNHSPTDLGTDTAGTGFDQKAEEQEALEKAIWVEKMKRASEQIQKTKAQSESSTQNVGNADDGQRDDGWQPPLTLHHLRPPQIKVPENWKPKSLRPSTDEWEPPATLPRAVDSEPPAPVPQAPKLASLNKLLADIKVTPPLRYEKPLVKKKSTKSSNDMGGKERNMGMAIDGQEEEEPSSASMAYFDTDFDVDIEDANEELDPLASKRSRESAGSNRGDLKRTRLFDHGEQMEGVEEAKQSEGGERSGEHEQMEADESDGSEGGHDKEDDKE
ncbi:hypothetical protein TWF718_006498 [Orbilia javanica]|uniref:Uncharacterized protein n=1 Tax=Orbilia javanica TaxID=47235 RepID=A0AAN8NYI3_9PEZI